MSGSDLFIDILWEFAMDFFGAEKLRKKCEMPLKLLINPNELETRKKVQWNDGAKTLSDRLLCNLIVVSQGKFAVSRVSVCVDTEKSAPNGFQPHWEWSKSSS